MFASKKNTLIRPLIRRAADQKVAITFGYLMDVARGLNP
jgi:hypothetical protein